VKAILVSLKGIMQWAIRHFRAARRRQPSPEGADPAAVRLSGLVRPLEAAAKDAKENTCMRGKAGASSIPPTPGWCAALALVCGLT